MSAAQNLQVQVLFIKSAEDEATIELPVPDAVFEFHVQQAVEKLLKALIAARGKSYPFTHDLQTLTDQLESIGEILPVFELPLAVFTKAGVTDRYDISTSITAVERERYRRIVKELREFVTNRVAVLP